jgi:hypothetical protein
MALEIKKNIIQNLLLKNKITLSNLWDLEQNMGKLLTGQDTLCYKNCEDVKLTIDSKINHLILENCKNMNIQLGGVISGIDITNCCDVTIKNHKHLPLNCLVIENSKHINIYVSKSSHNKIHYEISKCHAVKIQDYTNKYFYLKN